MLDKKEVVSAQVTGDGNIVILNSDNTTITIDTTNIIELRKQILNLQDQLKTFSPEVIQMMQQKVKEAGTDSIPVIDANIYFGIDIIIDGTSRGMGFSITITSLTKEHRYFTQPSFNLNHPYMGADSFLLTTPYGKSPSFPVRLEYGQPVTINFLIGQGQLSFFREVLAHDENAAIAVVSNTTVGEIYRSNEHTIKHILESYSKIMGR